ncbi:hypothetical protein GE061_000024 [Apolygus lucorum]|uniref:MULE transposase domain-containing protein n=1 Tax=Apolygus lucorum TaxID=248454 RepID=A0A8S9Y3F1_APOLU|nr:hypothetical protein GE061_000024 [Apolygus lucorum]
MREQSRSVPGSNLINNMFINNDIVGISVSLITSIVRSTIDEFPEANVDFKDVLNLRRVAYSAKRRKLGSRIPQSRQEVLTALRLMNTKTSKGEEMLLHVDETYEFVVFSSPTNLLCLSNSPAIFMDGTFDYAPKHFTQLYTLHGYNDAGLFIPLVFCLLPDKKESTYEKLFHAVTEKSSDIGFQLQPPNCVADFEKAVHNAAKKVWPTTNVRGCKFHLAQAWFRKIQNLGLVTEYKDEDSEIGDWLRWSFGLPMVNPAEASEAFCDWIINAPSDKAHRYGQYIHDTYIGDASSYPPEMWASRAFEEEFKNEGRSFDVLEPIFVQLDHYTKKLNELDRKMMDAILDDEKTTDEALDEEAEKVDEYQMMSRREQEHDGEQRTTDLEALMNFIKAEVDNEERIQLAHGFTLGKERGSKCKQPESGESIPTTATILSVEKSKSRSKPPYCIFCERKHESRDCIKAQLMDFGVKRELVHKRNACYICLKQNHRAAKCRAFVRCIVCTRKHHPVMCTKIKMTTRSKGEHDFLNKNVSLANLTIPEQQTLKTIGTSGDGSVPIRSCVSNTLTNIELYMSEERKTHTVDPSTFPTRPLHVRRTRYRRNRVEVVAKVPQVSKNPEEVQNRLSGKSCSTRGRQAQRVEGRRVGAEVSMEEGASILLSAGKPKPRPGRVKIPHRRLVAPCALWAGGCCGHSTENLGWLTCAI